MKVNNKILTVVFAIGLIVVLDSCASMPKKAKALENFKVNEYLGTWYEIARFDFRFERDLDNVSAQYSLNEKGDVIVLNSGYNYKKEEWKKAKGLARFRGDKAIAKLKVSFFGPLLFRIQCGGIGRKLPVCIGCRKEPGLFMDFIPNKKHSRRG